MTTMEMHPYYTEIPMRSFDAIVQDNFLLEVLLALITDPTDPHEIADTLVRTKDNRLFIRPPIRNEVSYPAPITLDDFVALGWGAVAKMKITLAQWVMTQPQAIAAMHWIAFWDHRFSVHCCCAVARQAMRFFKDDGTGMRGSMLKAIETAERWTVGRATSSDCFDALGPLDPERYVDVPHVASVVYAVTTILATVYRRDLYPAEEVVIFSMNAAGQSAGGVWGRSEIDRERDAEGVRLRQVIADACLSFPL